MYSNLSISSVFPCGQDVKILTASTILEGIIKIRARIAEGRGIDVEIVR